MRRALQLERRAGGKRGKRAQRESSLDPEPSRSIGDQHTHGTCNHEQHRDGLSLGQLESEQTVIYVYADLLYQQALEASEHQVCAEQIPWPVRS